MTRGIKRVWNTVAEFLPKGQGLPEENLARRHRAIVLVLWLHVPGVAAFGMARGHGVLHSIFESSLIALLAASAGYSRIGLRQRTVLATIGLMLSSAVLVHFSGGTIEMHFHFFVMVAVVTLYQSWVSFLVAIGFVVVHHGLAGALDPSTVYNHPAAVANPWKWAAIHGLFIMGESVAAIVAWRMNEEAQAQAKKSQAHFLGAFQHVGTGMALEALDGRYLEVNEKLCEMFGYARDELLGATWRVVTHPDDIAAVEVATDGLLADGQGHATIRKRIVRKDGRVRWVESSGSVIRDDDGHPAYLVVSTQDITDAVLSEEAMQNALTREQEVARQLRAVDEMKDAFLHAVSHELRTPLTSILGYSILLERPGSELSPERRQELLGRLATSARKLDVMLKDLLDLDRFARGILEPTLRGTDIRELVQRIVDDTDPRGRSLLLDAEPAIVNLDAPKVERILENLISNAIKYTPEGSSVVVRVEREVKGLLLIVDDDGPGVADEFKEGIFEPFQRGTQIVQHAPGTGIGLSLVRRFAELHGGRAWVQDRVGGGASFRVLIPIREDAEGELALAG